MSARATLHSETADAAAEQAAASAVFRVMARIQGLPRPRDTPGMSRRFATMPGAA
ncbi:hypothetical protein ACI2K6_13935 [Microbacterium sp. NPDC006705]|uniref:hypothetical protein n=1 Tax=Microbacterium sp. NPDC006705 TaxID=3364181 RepID=UPI00385158C2